MKNLLTKRLFILLLLPAAMLSSVQKKPIEAIMAQEETAAEKQRKASLLADTEYIKKKFARERVLAAQIRSLGNLMGLIFPRTKQQKQERDALVKWWRERWYGKIGKQGQSKKP